MIKIKVEWGEYIKDLEIEDSKTNDDIVNEFTKLGQAVAFFIKEYKKHEKS